MTDEAEKLLDQVLRLGEADRAKIAAMVLASLDERALNEQDRSQIDAAWQAEIERRLEQFRTDGRAVPWEAVRAKMRAARGR